MSIATLLEKITKKQKDRYRERQDAFRELVHSVADEREPDADRVEQILFASHKTVEDLQKAVEVLRQRREVRARLDTIPALEAERAKLIKQISAADRALEEAEQKHTITTGPLHARVQQIRDAIRDAAQDRQQMIETCTNQTLVQQLADVTARRAAAGNRRYEMQKQANDYTGWAKSDRRELVGASEFRAAELRGRIADHEKKAKACEDELAVLSVEIPELERQEAAIRERMLEP